MAPGADKAAGPAAAPAPSEPGAEAGITQTPGQTNVRDVFFLAALRPSVSNSAAMNIQEKREEKKKKVLKICDIFRIRLHYPENIIHSNYE